MDLYNDINELITAQFPEHREDYRINLLSDLMMNKIRTIATNFVQYTIDNPGNNISDLFNQYLDEH